MDITYVIMPAHSNTVQGQSCMKHEASSTAPQHNMWTQWPAVLLPDIRVAQYIHLPPAAAPCQIHMPDMQLAGTN